MSERNHKVYECDHLRLVAQDDGGYWCHIAPDGSLASSCEAGIYAVNVIAWEPHTISRLVKRLRKASASNESDAQ